MVLQKEASRQTLACFVEMLAGKQTVLELRDETAVCGCILSADHLFNIELSLVTVYLKSGSKRKYDRLLVKGKQIRFVHFPNDVDPIRTLRNGLRRPSHKAAMHGRLPSKSSHK